MCTDERYTELAPRIIGGPSGDYFLTADIPTGRWVEFRVLSIAEGDAQPGAILISHKSKPGVLLWDGTITLNDASLVDGLVYRLGQTSSAPLVPTWIRVLNSQYRVFLRIDVPNTTSAYVTIQFRHRVLDRVPGPSHEVHPDYMQNMNEARADAVRQRLEMKEEIKQGESLNARR